MESKINYLWNTHDVVNRWIQQADAKAVAILAAVGIFFGFIVSNIKVIADFISTSNCLLFFSVLSLLSLIIATIFAFPCIMPRIKVDEPNSNIYFDHIAQLANVDYKERVTAILGNSDKLQSEIINQIWANSRVAKKKYSCVSYSIYFLITAVILSFVLTLFYIWKLL